MHMMMIYQSALEHDETSYTTFIPISDAGVPQFGEDNEGARATLSRSSTTPFTSRDAPPAKTPNLPDFCEGLCSSRDGRLLGTSTGWRRFISLASSAMRNATWLHVFCARIPPFRVNTLLFSPPSMMSALIQPSFIIEIVNHHRRRLPILIKSLVLYERAGTTVRRIIHPQRASARRRPSRP